jgi:alanyl-tRNA synthetase
LFKIISEGSVAAGMRRIEAVTGEMALKYVQENDEMLLEIQQIINTPRKEIILQLDKLKSALKDKEKELKSIRQKMANLNFQKKEDEVRNIDGISILIKKVDGLNNSELRELADSLKQKLKSGVVVLGTISGDKVFLVTAVSKDLSPRLPAQEIIGKIAPLIGGGGGGRPDFAQAGGSKPDQLDQTLEKSFGILETMIRSS